MRIATVSQRLCLIKGGGAIDVHAASNGRFDTDPAMLYPRWREFAEWAASASLPDPQPFAPESLGSPSPAPRQVYGIGLNYSDHAAESGFRQAGHQAAGVHQVPLLHHRPVRKDHAAARRPHRRKSSSWS